MVADKAQEHVEAWPLATQVALLFVQLAGMCDGKAYTQSDLYNYQMWRMYDRKVLLRAGGVLDQPAGLMQKLFELDNISNLCERIAAKKSEAKNMVKINS